MIGYYIDVYKHVTDFRCLIFETCWQLLFVFKSVMFGLPLKLWERDIAMIKSQGGTLPNRHEGSK